MSRRAVQTLLTRITPVVGVAAVVALAPASPAGSVDDTTKPLLQVPARASFLQGGTIGEMLPVPD
jgi:hypothetical protein